MYTLGYAFRPWRDSKAIADGPSILAYISETARENGIDRQIRFGHRVVRGSVVDADARWTVEVERTDTRRDRAANVRLPVHVQRLLPLRRRLHAASSPGAERFAGPIVHPQHWTDDIDYAGKRVVVIGSGATAVTLVPALAAAAAHVTMLQRSPSYVLSLPAQDPIAMALRRLLPPKLAYGLVRWKNVLLTMLSFQLSRRRPELMKALIRKGVERQLPGRATTSTRTSRRATTRGTSACAWCPTATCSRRSATAARRSSPIGSTASPSTGSGSRPGTSSTPT